MSDSQAPPESEQIPCPFSHLLLALVAVAPAVITVPANLNIVLTAAITVWVGSKRSVKDTPPEESMTRTVGGTKAYPLSLAAMTYYTPLTRCFQSHRVSLKLSSSTLLQPISRLPLYSACLPGCFEIPSCGQRCPVWPLHHLQDSSQEPCQSRPSWLLCAVGSPGSDSNIAALH